MPSLVLFARGGWRRTRRWAWVGDGFEADEVVAAGRIDKPGHIDGRVLLAAGDSGPGHEEEGLVGGDDAVQRAEGDEPLDREGTLQVRGLGVGEHRSKARLCVVDAFHRCRFWLLQSALRNGVDNGVTALQRKTTFV